EALLLARVVAAADEGAAGGVDAEFLDLVEAAIARRQDEPALGLDLVVAAVGGRASAQRAARRAIGEPERSDRRGHDRDDHGDDQPGVAASGGLLGLAQVHRACVRHLDDLHPFCRGAGPSIGWQRPLTTTYERMAGRTSSDVPTGTSIEPSFRATWRRGTL